ncbi:hypothetical protein A2686_00835 [Candidatus Woesebacteria bacterium RIFCSPHIGHO2_01_FULL_38_10]|uniref:ChsH2 rubredoxin-like zinc ribbon domain-containing protein n=1 Tax=Candidatus Woesebacteria bacterium RIFCSPLOWO2_01_FULL_39_10b TaxID=1802517 RepID=A0A1F8B9C7_9BACT|nr:MAG: hypothetical protein A2686_00835 [Candidatus Woesebacteria bacterium RIFCSPHIGHO2_01_FULL_38_10]OGM60652.1 MAG: hypothetical protein A2892_01230 [Candidatus Woesebacteria bacterium RIFCSPLOWO2_01_FULL_39_10b]
MTPDISPARIWRIKATRLEGSNCGICGTLHFPVREVCPDCPPPVKIGTVGKGRTTNPQPKSWPTT